MLIGEFIIKRIESMKFNKILVILVMWCSVCAVDMIAEGLTQDERKAAFKALKTLQGITLVTKEERAEATEALNLLQKLSEKEQSLKKIVAVWSKLLVRAQGVLDAQLEASSTESDEKAQQKDDQGGMDS
jgi:hypothetical protein